MPPQRFARCQPAHLEDLRDALSARETRVACRLEPVLDNDEHARADQARLSVLGRQLQNRERELLLPVLRNKTAGSCGRRGWRAGGAGARERPPCEVAPMRAR